MLIPRSTNTRFTAFGILLFMEVGDSFLKGFLSVPFFFHSLDFFSVNSFLHSICFLLFINCVLCGKHCEKNQECIGLHGRQCGWEDRHRIHSYKYSSKSSLRLYEGMANFPLDSLEAIWAAPSSCGIIGIFSVSQDCTQTFQPYPAATKFLQSGICFCYLCSRVLILQNSGSRSISKFSLHINVLPY